MDRELTRSPSPGAWDLASPGRANMQNTFSPPRAPAARFALIDAFTSTAFAGNAAAVVTLPAFTHAWPADSALQACAAEMKHSETAFCFRRGDGPGYALRWFTPTSEVAMCGHATLAAAAALLEDGGTVLPISFHTKSGELRVSRDKGGVMLVISLPACPPVECPSATGVELSASLAAALRCPPPLWIGRSEGLGDIVAILPTEADVRAAAPDEALVKALGGRGVVITSLGDAGASHDVVSRCFYPNVGILEDPVTGSAHAAIAPLWEARLGHSSLRCAQASARGGELRASMERDGFVELAGAHITVVRGELCVKL